MSYGMDYDNRTDRFYSAMHFFEVDTAKAVQKFLAGDDSVTVEWATAESNTLSQMSVSDALSEFVTEYADGRKAFVTLLRGGSVQDFTKSFVKHFVETFGEDAAECLVAI